MTIFDQKAWASKKKLGRILQYRRRMEHQRHEAEPAGQWLAAIRRDDALDLVERSEPPRRKGGKLSCCG